MSLDDMIAYYQARGGKPQAMTRRRCLRCGRPFKAQGRFRRLCDDCGDAAPSGREIHRRRDLEIPVMEELQWPRMVPADGCRRFRGSRQKER